MFIKTSTRNTKEKTYKNYYLAESFRDKKSGKVKHRHIANLSSLPQKCIVALKSSLNDNSDVEKQRIEDLEVIASKEYGSIAVFSKIFDKIFGKIISNKYFNEIKAMTINRIFEPKSKNGLQHWIKQVDGLKIINNKDLYKAIDYLEENKDKIEQDLFKNKQKKNCQLYLYDITSTYFEGEAVDMAKYGYSRDKRNDRLQVNIGLVTDEQGYPITVEILEGNVADKSTLQGQIDKLREKFGIEEVTFVFDRGMKTKMNLEYIEKEGFDYITALNHQELKKKTEENSVIQQSLFDKEELSEFTIENKKYVLSHNPTKAEKDTQDREILIEKTEKILEETQNMKRKYKLTTLQDKISRKIDRYKCERYFNYWIEEEEIDGKKYGRLRFERNEEKIEYDKQFDGFYMIESSRKDIKGKDLEEKYKSLQIVENAFDYVKNLIEIRPVFHWKDRRVKGHIFMCFMSYYLLQEFRQKTKELLKENSLDELLTELRGIKKTYLKIMDISGIEKITKLTEKQEQIIKQCKIKL